MNFRFFSGYGVQNPFYKEDKKEEVKAINQNIKKMDIREFREKGFLQEANRLFFHPLGLALEVSIEDSGKEYISGIWDYRNDDEGVLYCDDICTCSDALRKKSIVDIERASHSIHRLNQFGFIIQPLSEPPKEE